MVPVCRVFGWMSLGLCGLLIPLCACHKQLTSTSLTSRPNPSTLGNSVTLTATVTSSGGTPKGRITFHDLRQGRLATVPLSSGLATLNASTLQNDDGLYASYSGNLRFERSVSSTIEQSVSPNLAIPADTVLPTEVDTQGVAAGNTAGSLQVSADGDLAYNFPLWLPHGRNGMQPELALSYRSRSSNDLVGVGWSVAGLSQIRRCAQTTAQNGQNGAIAFDSTDRFCLDGQQLVAISGTYGADKTEYRTERDMFAKIVSGGSDSQGPGWFKVYLKNGRILYYGTSPDSLLQGQRVHTFPVSVGGAPPGQGGAITSWISTTDDTDHISYIGQDHHVYEIYQSTSGSSAYDDLTQISGAPHHAQGGALTSWVSSTDNVQHVAYIGDDGHVYETYMPVGQQPWAYDDLTQISGAPHHAQGGALTSWVSSTDNVQHVAYIGDDGHVYETYMPVGQQPWAYDDLTQISGAPHHAQGGALTSWVSSTDNVQHVAYIGDDGHVYETYMPVGQQPWAYDDATNTNGAILPESGALTSWFSAMDKTQHIAYLGQGGGLLFSGGHPDALSMRVGQLPWHFNDFTAGGASVGIDRSQAVRLGWALARSEDRYGNGINYSYTLQETSSIGYDEPTYEFRPDVISYTDTANKSWPALKSIKFIYEPRPDALTFYVSGLRMTFANRLTGIEVTGPNAIFPALVRSYRLAYENDSVTQRSLLSTLTECDGLGVCKAPLMFSWELGSMAFLDIDTGIHDDSSSNQTTESDGGRFEALAVADVNGDGLDDLLFYVSGNNATLPGWYYRPNLGYKEVAPLGNIFGAGHSASLIDQPGIDRGNVRFVDMDRDGRADLIVSQYPIGSNFSVQAYLSTPTVPFSNLVFNERANGHLINPTNHNSYVADFDGNGFPDIFLSKDAQTWYFNLNSGPSGAGCGAPSLFGCQTLLPQASGVTNIVATNVDGGGTTQLMLRNPGPSPPHCLLAGCPGIWYAPTKLSSGTVVSKNVGLLAGEVFPNGEWCAGSTPCFQDLFIDLNGDGLPDVVSVDTTKGGCPWIAINTGNGFLTRNVLCAPIGKDGASGWFPPYEVNGQFVKPGILTGDLNHEGKQDVILVGVPQDSGQPVALMPITSGLGGFGFPFFLQDLNGNNLPAPDNPTINNVIFAEPVGPLAVLADLNGDGLPDLLEVVNGELHAYIRTPRLPDVITRVVEGTTESYAVSWTPISNPDIHQSVVTCSFPTVCAKNAIWVVSDVASDDGAGGTRHLSYKYLDGRSDGLGRGWLGFDQRQETDSATGIVSLTTFDNSTQSSLLPGPTGTYVYPFAGLPQIESFQVALDNGDTFSQTRTTSYQYSPDSGSPFYSVLPSMVTEKQFDASPQNIGPIREITRTYLYDAFANPTKVTRVTGDGYTSTTSTSYDNNPEVWLVTMPTQVVETQTTPSGESVTQTTAYNFDATTGFLLGRIIEPSGDRSVTLSQQLSRDGTGHILSITESSADQQRTTQIYYDNNEDTWPTLALDPLLHSHQYAYHPSFGVLVGFEDENENTTWRQLDGFGRLRSESPPDGANVNISYTTCAGCTGYTVTASRKGGQEVQSFIDGLGRPIYNSHRGFTGLWIEIDRSFDSAGLLAQISNPYFLQRGGVPSGYTTATYDALGRLRILTNPDGSTIKQDYSGLTTAIYDENRHRTTLLEDQLGRTNTLTEYADDGHEINTGFAYGPFGALESVTDPVGNITSAKFDTRGRRILLVDPDSGSHVTQWNPFGEVVGEQDAAGDSFSYQRDVLGRPVNIKSKEGTATVYWDESPHGIGEIARATSTDNIRSDFKYDIISRLSSRSVQADHNYRFAYTYDPVGRLATIQYPTSARALDAPPFVVSFNYTQYGALCSVKDVTSSSGVTFWQTTARNEFDQITGEVFGNAVSTSRQFDLRSRLWSLETNSNGLPIQSLVYQYYPNGNLESRTDRINRIFEGYKYDSLNRLKQWDVNKNDNRDLSQSFSYDDIGNIRLRTTLYGSGDDLTYEYSQIHAGPHAVTAVNNGTYSYDLVGREFRAPGRHTEYRSWGLPSRIVGMRHTDRFKYDFEDQRILKLRSDGIHFATVGGLFERMSNGNNLETNRYYVGAADRVVAAVVWDEQSKKHSVHYLHDDRLGSVAAITKESGGMAEARAYDPFGTLREAADPSIPIPPSSLESVGFTEREPDPEVGLINMLGRLYDSKIGRFTTADPLINPPNTSQGYNRYSYVLNNPLRWTDPSGLQCVELCFSIAGTGPVTLPSEWEPYTPSPPLLTGLDSPPTGPPLISAGISDDTGLAPPLIVSPPPSPAPSLEPATIPVAAENGFVDVPRVPYLENKRLSAEIDLKLMELGDLVNQGLRSNPRPTTTAMYHEAIQELLRWRVRNWDAIESTTGPIEWVPMVVSGGEFLEGGLGLLRGLALGGAAEGATIAGEGETSLLLQRYLSGSGGRWGSRATRALNDSLATDLESQGYTITGGAGRASEEWIPGLGGGTKGGTFVDITATNGTSTVRIQTISTLADGVTPTPSEAAAAARIRAAFPNDLLHLVPKW